MVFPNPVLNFWYHSTESPKTSQILCCKVKNPAFRPEYSKRSPLKKDNREQQILIRVLATRSSHIYHSATHDQDPELGELPAQQDPLAIRLLDKVLGQVPSPPPHWL